MAIFLNLRFDATGDWNRLRGSIPSFVRAHYGRLSFDLPRRDPELPRDLYGVDRRRTPPGLLVAVAMIVAVMRSTQRYREFIADLAPHRAGLGEAQMVGVGGASPAN